MIMTKVEDKIWIDSYETTRPKNQERYLIKHSLITNENYLGFIEMCHLNDLNEYNINYSVRFNHINGFPKITILKNTYKARNFKDANTLYLTLKQKIENYIF